MKTSFWVVVAAVAPPWWVACEGKVGGEVRDEVGGHDAGGGADGGVTSTSTSPSSTSSGGTAGSGGAEPEAYFDWGAGVGIAPYHACVIRPDTSVTCFGKQQLRTTPPEGFRAVAIGSGHLHNCAILARDSEARIGCFGFSASGDETPLEPPADFAPSQISVGEGTNCAVDATGTVRCWFADYVDAAPPRGFQAKQVSISAAFSCGIGMDDRVICWGLNPPELPRPDLRARQIVVAQSEASADPPETRTRHACAVLLDRSVVCWGDDVEGEVSEVPDGLEAVDVALGYTEACAVSVDGDLVCWGKPPGGFERPANVRARSVKISQDNGCALLEDADQLVCWGFNDPERYANGTPDGEEVYVPSR